MTEDSQIFLGLEVWDGNLSTLYLCTIYGVGNTLYSAEIQTALEKKGKQKNKKKKN